MDAMIKVDEPLLAVVNLWPKNRTESKILEVESEGAHPAQLEAEPPCQAWYRGINSPHFRRMEAIYLDLFSLHRSN